MIDDLNNTGSSAAHVSIILLNWNGFDDTLACLKSLSYLDYHDFDVILIDNASRDHSVDNLRTFLSGAQESCLRKYFLSDSNSGKAEGIELLLITNEENQGFAKGNNTGVKIAMDRGSDYILMLNNDTEVKPDFLSLLIKIHTQYPTIGVSTPQIRYFDKDEVIWNCGGRLTRMGGNKYYYEGCKPDQIREKELIEIQFITGCALFTSAQLLRKFGLLSENFFFGEEDYEFSLRMKKHGVRMVCVVPAVIYHKVSSSVARASSEVVGRIYIHYLNRFVNLRNYMPSWKWTLWRFAFLHYIFLVLMMRYHVKFQRCFRVTTFLWKESKRLNSVNKTTFDTYFSCDFSGTKK